MYIKVNSLYHYKSFIKRKKITHIFFHYNKILYITQNKNYNIIFETGYIYDNIYGLFIFKSKIKDINFDVNIYDFIKQYELDNNYDNYNVERTIIAFNIFERKLKIKNILLEMKF